MHKILFVTRDLREKEISGGLAISRRNFDLLAAIYGIENIDVFVIEKPSFLTRILNVLFCQGYGQTHKNFSLFKKKLQGNYTVVFYNSSVYGTFVRYAAKKKQRQIVFYHNIEYKYYLDKFHASKKSIDLLYACFIRRNEALASKYSDYRFTFNSRDSNDMEKQYRVPSSLELPISFPFVQRNKKSNLQNNLSPYYLFVGSDFFANSNGLSWFIENIAVHLSIDFYIIGSVCNSLKQYENFPYIHLLGFVENLEMYYGNAAFIVSPIFSGSGMKTKTVEALSFGKTIFGTEEAFVGIDGDYSQIGSLCMTPQDFIAAIKTYDMKKTFNDYAYSLFLKKYSNESVLEKLRSFLLHHNF